MSYGDELIGMGELMEAGVSTFNKEVTERNNRRKIPA
jgi:hypothetical protein